MKNFKQEFQLLLNLYRQKKFFEAEILSKRLINIYPDNANIVLDCIITSVRLVIYKGYNSYMVAL